MKNKIPHIALYLSLLALAIFAPKNSSAAPFTSIVYHNVLTKINSDKFAVRTRDMVEQFEYLKTHGYHPVSMDDIIRSGNTGKRLPDKAVLITVDDGLESFYTTVFPLLKLYKFPAVLSVVASWVENGRAGSTNIKGSSGYEDFRIMTWEQLKEVSTSGLVEIASHSYDLHKGILFNPQGNKFAAGSSFSYSKKTMLYETDTLFRKRIHADLSKAVKLIKKNLGFSPRIMVWPYGEFNRIGSDIADSLGMSINFSVMDGVNSTGNINIVKRGIVTGDLTLGSFVTNIRRGFVPDAPKRAVQVDLDLIYDEDQKQQERNIGKLLDRLLIIGVNTVFLQAFSDIDGDGNASSLYFPNHILPVKADLFNRVSHQIKTRTGAEEVYAWLPLLSFVLPDKEQRKKLLVREAREGGIRASKESYQRLSPFSPESLEIVTTIYKDVARNANISGILFQDDGYLTDFEDFHPDAVRAFEREFNMELTEKSIKSRPEMVKKWTKYKTDTLINFSKRLEEAVSFYRPGAKFSRNIYAGLLTNPASEEWFAQNFKKFLNSYDYVVVMAYPEMEKQKAPVRWLKALTNVASTCKDGFRKTIFKLQTFNWLNNKWVSKKALRDQIYALITSGATHIAYYPDNLYLNQPPVDFIKRGFSMKDSPFYP